MSDILFEAKDVGKRFGGATEHCGEGPAMGGGVTSARGMRAASGTRGHA